MNEPKNKHFILILSLLCLFTYNLSAQVNDRKDTIKSWEVGADLLWLIDKNQVPATSVFARYNFVTRKNKLRAWRLRLGVNVSINDSTQIGDPLDNERNIFAPYLRAGYEWQHKVANKTTFFYGADVSLFYFREKIKEVVTIGPPPGFLSQEINKTLEIGLIGFAGAKYQPVPWLAFSIESSLNIIYRIRRDKFKTTSFDFPDDEGFHGFIHVNELNIRFAPITVINLSFYINR